jgi:hypothetical protein
MTWNTEDVVFNLLIIDKESQEDSYFLSGRDIATAAHIQVNGPYILVTCCWPADKAHNCP